VAQLCKTVTVAIVSTVPPGTFNRTAARWLTGLKDPLANSHDTHQAIFER
jgi:hypothetical protein